MSNLIVIVLTTGQTSWKAWRKAASHGGGRFFKEDNVIWHQSVRSIAVGCSSRAVMPLLGIQWSFLLHTPQQRLGAFHWARQPQI